MKYQGIRSGTYARIDGVEYKGVYDFRVDEFSLVARTEENPNPALYYWDEQGKFWTADVPVARCERVYRVNTYARFRGEPVNLTTVGTDGMAEIYYDGQNFSTAVEELGFVQEERFVARRQVYVTELVDVYEKQTDLVVDSWREGNFTRPSDLEQDRFGNWWYPPKKARR